MSKYNRRTNPHYAQRRADARDDHLWKQDLALQQQADKVRWSIPEAVRAEQERLDKEWDKLAADHTTNMQRIAQDVMGDPWTEYMGGVTGALTLTHWKTPVASTKVVYESDLISGTGVS